MPEVLALITLALVALFWYFLLWKLPKALVASRRARRSQEGQ